MVTLIKHHLDSVGYFFEDINFQSLMKRLFSPILLAAGLTLLQLALTPPGGQNTLHAENSKIILRHADMIEGGEDAVGPYRAAIGNVEMLKGELTMTCRRTTDYDGQNRIIMNGDVSISDGSMEVFGDDGVFYTDREVLELSGNVRGRMKDNSLAVRSKKGMFNNDESQLWFYDDAVGWKGKDQVSGEIILLHFRKSEKKGDKRTIDEMQLHGNAFYASPDTLIQSPVGYDQMSGKKIVALIGENSRIEGLTVTGQAESLFHLYDENSKPTGINYSSGDRIRMIFREGRMHTMKVTGNAEGTEYPASFRGEESINLPKFAWRAAENPWAPPEKKDAPVFEGLFDRDK
ncbi:hypothetical protein [Chlorobium phaeovibrioides]|nr:hypothetical protein [Chlorobium phaeovibrioides]